MSDSSRSGSISTRPEGNTLSASMALGPSYDRQMVSFMSLPVELVLEIVRLILDNRLALPAVGQEAAMAAPLASQITWNLQPTFKKRIIQRIPWVVWRHFSGTKQRVQQTGVIQEMHCNLKSLRATNRFLDEICRPFLYKELNLMSDLKLKQWKRVNRIIPQTRWSLIQSIWVYMDPADLQYSDPLVLDPFVEHGKTVAYILTKCKNLKSVALYYHNAAVRTMDINFALLSLFKEGCLTSLGIYSCRLLQTRIRYDENTEKAEGVLDLLESIALYEPAQRSLRALDVVADWIPESIFDLIRSNFTALTSLTLRRVVREPWFKSRMWDIDQQPKWNSYPNLTRLHLDDFEPGHAAHFPALVRHFTALDELKISACGRDYNGAIKWRSPGWSQRPNALCATHRRLKYVYMAHMEGWEVYELGVIPTATVIVTTIKPLFLLELFREDDELFPGMQVLRLAPQHLPGGVWDFEDGMPSISDICSARNVDLRHDAPTMYWTCRCPFHST